MDWGKLCQEAGIAMTLTVAGIVILLLLIKWILEQFKSELEANRAERTSYLDTLHKIREEISDHNARSKEFCANVALEHKEMIATLGRINGWKHD